MNSIRHTFFANLTKASHLAPLAVFRILLGSILFLGVIRFYLNGWIDEMYVEPKFFFSYYGFEWLPRPNEFFLYAIFGLMALGFLGIALGLFYRVSASTAFLCFTYIELLDKTNYLNHYYFVSLVCLLLLFVPAHRYFSIDSWRKPSLHASHAPYWTLLVFKLQLGIVYFFAGVAKLNSDWLFEAMPLIIWLPAKADLPLLGPLLSLPWLAFLFSWFGAAYDLCIPFLLWRKNTRVTAFVLVAVFHLLTWLLFPIGLFPFIMIASSLIFFSSEFHLRIIGFLRSLLPSQPEKNQVSFVIQKQPLFLAVLSFFFFVQLLLPMRYLAYPGDLFWTEEGYRFSWRVMLMEKAGYVIFHITDPKTGLRWEAQNYAHLSSNQEKMMSTQADMILQFAHYLKDWYALKGVQNPIITAEAYVSLNGRMSQAFINPEINLCEIKDGFAHKSWILPSPKTLSIEKH